MNLTSKLSSNQKIFFAEIIGTFVVVACATGSVVLHAKSGGTIGTWFEAFAPFVGVCLMVYTFGKISRAHFNPAVTISYFITKHITKTHLPIYFGAESIGAFLGIIFVKNVIGTEAYLGVNTPNYSFPIWMIFGVEVLATALLMAVIMLVVHTNGLRGFSGIAIGGMIGLDIFFFAFISGASMNPIRSLAPAVFSGVFDNLWLYWTATFVGTSIVGFVYKRKFVNRRSA
ncbi:MIP/aquaporin family protein [Candidatus Nitrosotalea okcheonensis]|uniref:Major intrinsic protein n=1 Tax=Candidatus Nitrosotalea okcheonensis TaxID=1903276 RepID=A0A2H1FER7_9ARCH|nr:aquaporin [Candidatus Nitrosotalea okcheonensis]SMH71248.1 Major intrinsic protein [Candidatus Nitrosotalea okcheonensis]